MSAGRLHNPRLLINSLRDYRREPARHRTKGIKAYEKEVEKYEDKEKVSKKQEAALAKTRDTKVKKRFEKIE